MRLLKAIGKMLACLVAVIVIPAAWGVFCYRYFGGGWHSFVVMMAPPIIWIMASLTLMFYKQAQP